MPGILGDYVYGSGLEPQPDALVVSRKINPRTKDYYRDSEGLPEEEDPLRMRVLLALTQIRGDFLPDPELGDESNRIDRDQAGLAGKVFRNAERALKDMIAAGEIELLGVDVEVGPGKWARAIRWRKVGENGSRTTTL
jgi:hypothetical protein